MTDREAIELFEGECKICSDMLQDICYERRKQGKVSCENMAALIALQEREERSKGCEYCNNKELPTEGGVHDFRILGNAIYYYDDAYGWEGTSIEYCPHCGKQLKGAEE